MTRHWLFITHALQSIDNNLAGGLAYARDVDVEAAESQLLNRIYTLPAAGAQQTPFRPFREREHAWQCAEQKDLQH